MEDKDIAKIKCKKCLIRDMDKNVYFKNMYDYIANLDEDIKASNEKYEQRLQVCKECDYLDEGMCKACGCFVELRAVIEKNTCSYNKW